MTSEAYAEVRGNYLISHSGLLVPHLWAVPVFFPKTGLQATYLRITEVVQIPGLPRLRPRISRGWDRGLYIF